MGSRTICQNQMKKRTNFIFLFFCAAMFSGCAKVGPGYKPAPAQEGAQQRSGIELSVATSESEQKALPFEPNMTFSDLVSSIEKNEMLECKYLIQDEETLEDIEANAYVDGEKYKTITYTSGGDTLYSIFDGEVFYSWSKDSAEGFKMEKNCARRFSGTQQEQEDDGEFDLGSFKTSNRLFEEDVVINCQPTPYVDVSVPAEVRFVDQCEMLEGQIEAIRQSD